MCFLADKLERNSKVAIKDINVYKIVKNHPVIGAVCSVYHTSFFWKLNKVFHEYMKTTSYGANYSGLVTSVDDGFHSYSPEKTFLRIYHSRSSISNPDGYNVLHVFSDKNTVGTIDCHTDSDEYWKLALLKCVIPTGSHYYENSYGEIVSDTIMPISCELVDFDKWEGDIRVKF